MTTGSGALLPSFPLARHPLPAYTASDSDVKLKSFTRRLGIT